MPAKLTDLFESLVPEQIATGFTFTEGPLWHPSGTLYFNDIRPQESWKVDLTTGATVLLRCDTGSANGQTFDAGGRLVICEMAGRRVSRAVPDGPFETVADQYDGKQLNQPNDIVLKSDGSLYFTNPEGRLANEEREIGYAGVYRVLLDGGVQEVCAGINLPNGLAFSPDESQLYVANTRPDPKLLVYDLAPDGTARGEAVFSEMPFTPEGQSGGVPDGLKVDIDGRIYCTGPGGLWIWEANGDHVGVLELPELPANLNWGGEDNRTVFLTCRTSVYSLRATTPGVAIPLK